MGFSQNSEKRRTVPISLVASSNPVGGDQSRLLVPCSAKAVMVGGEAFERRSVIEVQKVDWERIHHLASHTDFYGALEKTIQDADCLTAQERDELRSSICEEMKDLHAWVAERRLRRREHWFVTDPSVALPSRP